MDTFNLLDYLSDADSNECAVTMRSPTVPAPFVVEDKLIALFLTAQWKLTAYVDGKFYDSLPPIDHARSKEFIKEWALRLLRKDRRYLESIGVDVVTEYAKLGGDTRDL